MCLKQQDLAGTSSLGGGGGGSLGVFFLPYSSASLISSASAVWIFQLLQLPPHDGLSGPSIHAFHTTLGSAGGIKGIISFPPLAQTTEIPWSAASHPLLVCHSEVSFHCGDSKSFTSRQFRILCWPVV